MRSFIAPALLALAASVAAIKITSPAKNDVIDPAAGVTVKWTTVSSDPKKAHLMLVNMAGGHTPFSKDLGEVDLSKGSIDITEKGVPADEGFQFNFQSVDENNTGILAQSEQFEVKASGETDDDEDKTSSAAAATSTSAETAKTSAVTKTVTDEDGETKTVTSATTFATVSTTGTATVEETASTTASASATASTGAAAPAMAVQGGSLLALVAGVAALMA